MTQGSTEALARLAARIKGRALVVRDTSAMWPDPSPVFGIAPIRVVSEQRVQALAFGDLGASPRFVVNWNPLSREASSLEPFARSLDDYLMACLASGRLPRVWLPHGAALEVIDLLGHRYRTNKKATDTLRRMGWQCRVLAEEATYPGQQVVVVAGDILLAHVVTGQSPTEDRHLGALIAWIDARPLIDPEREAARRSLEPAASLLERTDDDEVERLRRAAKKGGIGSDVARRRIEAILRTGARKEWDLLVEARAAFWAMSLPVSPVLSRQVNESQRRIAYRLRDDLNRPTRPHSLARLLDEHEYAIDLLDETNLRGDALQRERSRLDGRVVAAVTVRANQPVRNRHPCTLVLRTRQEVLRIRNGTELQTTNGLVRGRVRAIGEDPGSEATVIDLELQKGVRRSRRPRVGQVLDWIDAVPYDGRFRMRDVYRAMENAASPLAYGEAVPQALPRSAVASDLGAIARSLRRV